MVFFSNFSVGASHQLSATRLLSSPDGSRHPPDGIEPAWPWNDSYSSLHRDTYMEVRTTRAPRITLGCFQACRARIHHSLAKRKVHKIFICFKHLYSSSSKIYTYIAVSLMVRPEYSIEEFW